jgi:hypothetical protein
VDTKKPRAVETALKLANVAEQERVWIAALPRGPQYRPAASIEAMRAIAVRYRDDLDLQTLYAESLMLPVRWRWRTQAAGPPDHHGANHSYIHAVASSRMPERGIASAQRPMGIAPAAGHLVHMPGHIWLALGEDETAAIGVTQSAYAGY